jgi:hypothetical protein
VASFVGVRQVSDAFSKHDAVDAHVQSTTERVVKGAGGSLQLVVTATGLGGLANGIVNKAATTAATETAEEIVVGTAVREGAAEALAEAAPAAAGQAAAEEAGAIAAADAAPAALAEEAGAVEALAAEAAPPASEGPLFGQKRVGPNFGTKGRPPELAGRPIADVAADLRAGTLSADKLPIEAFQLPDGRLVSANTRSLAALSEAGLKPTKVTIIQPTQELLNRLKEVPIIPNAPLPGPRVPVTPSQSNLTVLRVIELP